MAEQESDREDLMREATALVRRAELLYPRQSEQDPVIVGFRRDGRLSCYFGADPVCQFDDQHCLRRAYVAGFLYRTQGGTLARLARHRAAGETQLVRHDLSPRELMEFRLILKKHLRSLHAANNAGEVTILSQIPDDGAILEELRPILAEILERDIPLAPAIPGKR